MIVAIIRLYLKSPLDEELYIKIKDYTQSEKMKYIDFFFT